MSRVRIGETFFRRRARSAVSISGLTISPMPMVVDMTTFSR